MSEYDEDAYTFTPCGRLGGMTGVAQGGKFLGEFVEMEDALTMVKERMESEQYWPSLVWVSDHGNWWYIDTEGNEVPHEDDDEE